MHENQTVAEMREEAAPARHRPIEDNRGEDNCARPSFMRLDWCPVKELVLGVRLTKICNKQRERFEELERMKAVFRAKGVMPPLDGPQGFHHTRFRNQQQEPYSGSPVKVQSPRQDKGTS